MSARSATSAAVAQAVPPAASRASGTLRRDLRNRLWPAAIRCPAMGAPMMPRPMNPMFMGIDPGCGAQARKRAASASALRARSPMSEPTAVKRVPAAM